MDNMTFPLKHSFSKYHHSPDNSFIGSWNWELHMWLNLFTSWVYQQWGLQLSAGWYDSHLWLINLLTSNLSNLW